MLKIRKLIFPLVMMLLFYSGAAFAQSTAPIIDKGELDSGIVSINYKSASKKAVKVMIAKGKESYTYDLDENNTFPLQLGNGKYTITVLEHVSGTRYRSVQREEVTLKLKDDNAVFLQSIQLINWNDEMEAMEKAVELTKNAKTDRAKVTAIYNYIVKNISYDNKKAATVKAGYLPSIEDVLADGKGICYDYAALFAAMLRSLDVPTKLVMGYNKDIKAYHAWNQVFLDGKWVTIDTTYDAAFKKAGQSITMIKADNNFTVEKLY